MVINIRLSNRFRELRFMDVVILVNIKLVISALFQDIIQGRPCFFFIGNGDKLRDFIGKGGGLVLCSINTYEQTQK
jgi:hypothetical protein